jgi:hypothetical protein
VSRRRLALVAALGAAAPVAVGATLAARGGSSAPHPGLQEVGRIHAALHTIGRLCTHPADARNAPTLEQQAQTLLVFARRYPDSTFRIDDETGRTTSLLLVGREALRRCAPPLAHRLDDALPTSLRSMP